MTYFQPLQHSSEFNYPGLWCPICRENNEDEKIGHVYIDKDNSPVQHSHCVQCFNAYAMEAEKVAQEVKCLWCMQPVKKTLKDHALTSLSQLVDSYTLASMLATIILGTATTVEFLETLRWPSSLKTEVTLLATPGIMISSIATAGLSLLVSERMITQIKPKNNLEKLKQKTLRCGCVIFSQLAIAAALKGTEGLQMAATDIFVFGTGILALNYAGESLFRLLRHQ